MPFAVCMLKDRKGSAITTKCGRNKGVVIKDVTVWWRDVTCPKCLALMNTHESTQDPEPTPDPPRRKLVRRKKAATS